MSIASELTTLAANKAAIKAAIEAKNPATAPTDALSQWPASIASIPSGSSVPYDAEVEYLQGDGSSTYINTGLPYASIMNISLDIIATPTSSEKDFVGYYGTASGAINCVIGFYNNFVFNFITNSGRIDSSALTVAEQSLSINLAIHKTGRVLTVNDTDYSSSTSLSFNDENSSFYVFCAGPSLRNYSSMKLKALSMSIAGTTVRDFIPVRVGSGANAVGYLYDRANPTGGPNGNGLYGTGAGTLIIGPDKT